MAEVGAAFPAKDFNAMHAVAVIILHLYAAFVCCKERWPAAARVIFRFRREKDVAAGSAFVFSNARKSVVFAAERDFCAFLAKDAILLWSQLFVPFSFSLGFHLV